MLTVFILLDTSASMSGAPLEAMKQGFHLLRGTLTTRDATSMRVAVISYESQVQELLPLTTLDQFAQFPLPELQSGGTSALGKALLFVENRLPSSGQVLLYIFTDGDPTDDWKNALEKPRQHDGPKLKICGLACGLNADKILLQRFCDEVYALRDMTSDLLFSTFRTLG